MACNKCNSTSSCSCSSVTGSTVAPYYASADCCLEDSTTKIYYQQYALGFSIESSWNIPQCGGAALIKVPGVTTAPVGAYIWNASFGYFEINSFDAASEMLSISNPCFADNAAPGVEVPRCTVFTVSPPPCCDGTDQAGVFVKVDFTAPGVSVCIPITVTSLENLAAGDVISIGSGIYSLQSIDSADVITICNDGSGIIPGTSVIAKDLSGDYVYPIYVVSNCCSNIDSDQTSVITATATAVSLPVALDTLTTAVGGISITNPSTNRDSHVMVHYLANSKFGQVITGVPTETYIRYDIQTSVNGSPYATLFPFVLQDQSGPALAVPDPVFFKQVVGCTVHTIAPGATLTINGKASIQNYDASTNVTQVSINLEIKALVITA